jgi:2-polyprenyl-3-methyl-5-hydroxy-6-metoxy-1,4-benzoquinol methylase
MTETSLAPDQLPNLPDYAVSIHVDAQRRVAFNSPDHIHPHGTRRDNSRNPRFNVKLYWLFQQTKTNLTILDLGCSGGGFVRDCLNDGCLAVGLEGSDYSLKRRRAEWAVIPEYLFVCDVTAPFEVTMRSGTNSSPQRLQFDVVTSWELLEHIAEPDLPTLADNVRHHLKPGGLWIMSIAPHHDKPAAAELHQTVHPKSWWVRKFGQMGFQQLEGYVEYFNTQFVRGPKFGAPGSFHLVLCAEPTLAPHIPALTRLGRLFDIWNGSTAQKLLRRLIVG